MLYGYLIATYATLIVSCIMIKKHINYSLFEQISHILPSLILAIVMGTTITTIEHKLVMGDAMQLILQLGLGGLAYIALAWGSHLEIMDDIVNMLKEKFHK
jgi:hypothetical protein